MFSEKKQKKIKKKTVNQNSISVNSIPVENNNIVKKKVSNKLNGVVKTEPINAKKAKLKALLENKSMRSHIDITKTSNSLRQRMLERFKGESDYLSKSCPQ